MGQRSVKLRKKLTCKLSILVKSQKRLIKHSQIIQQSERKRNRVRYKPSLAHNMFQWQWAQLDHYLSIIIISLNQIARLSFKSKSKSKKSAWEVNIPAQPDAHISNFFRPCSRLQLPSTLKESLPVSMIPSQPQFTFSSGSNEASLSTLLPVSLKVATLISQVPSIPSRDLNSPTPTQRLYEKLTGLNFDTFKIWMDAKYFLFMDMHYT